ncbi:MAG: ABC transporter substrate-binding protein, partial [Candidatus Binataceae bacterium]
MNNRVIRAVAAAIAAAIFLTGCPSAGPPLKLPPGATVLRLAEVSDVPTLDPAEGYDTVSWEFEQMLFDTLVRYGAADVKLHPDIAVSWTVSPDAETFTFHLRHDAYFSNGRPVTSADFRYAIERVINPKTRSKGMEYYRSIVGARRFAAGRADHVSGIETPDPWTIAFHLKKPDPMFADKLAMPFASAGP